MTTAFQSNAFQNNAFQIDVTPIIVIGDTHDGDYKKRHKKLIDDERDQRRKRRESIIHAYERLVEGKPEVAEEIVAPFVKPATKKRAEPELDFDRLLASVTRTEALWRAYLDMDDEEVLMLL